MTTAPLELLAGVRVVAFTQFLLGPAAAQYLADMGADVVKVEQPVRGPHERNWSGAGSFVNGVSTFFLLAHRNVRSVAIDLKHAEARQLVLELCRDADVVLVNFRPGVMERLGLSAEDLKRENPSLIYACGSGYGSDSPYRDLPGQDLLLQAATGLAAVTGQADGPPVAAGAAVVDQHAAALLAMGILGALHHRTATGQGQKVEVTMAQAGLDLQAEPLLYHLNGGLVQRPRVPLGSSFHEAPYGFYPVRDGQVALSLSPMRQVSTALGDPAQLEPYLDPDDALVRREEIYSALSPLLQDFTVAEIVGLLRRHGVWCAPVNDYDAAVAEPFIDHLDPIEDVEHPRAGRIKLLRHPVAYGSGKAQTRRPPPLLGEHTEEVLRDAGVGLERIRRLQDLGVIGGSQHPFEKAGPPDDGPPGSQTR
jgi:crotonobetainyl-CoA:carnitine CoA-transferase CaiB-like acyl-CoA transferase